MGHTNGHTLLIGTSEENYYHLFGRIAGNGAAHAVLAK